MGKIMKEAKALTVLCAGVAGLALQTGCTFCLLDGNGPQSQASVAAELPTADATGLAKWKSEVDSLSFHSTPPVGKEFAGYSARQGRSPGWHILAGSGIGRTLLAPGDAGKRTVLRTDDTSGFLFPLFGMMDSKQLDAESGECLARGKATTLTALIVHGSEWKPVNPDKNATPAYLSKQTNLADVKYDKSSGMCIGFGLLAWGQKNNRAYFQLAWIPIPLWSLE